MIESSGNHHGLASAIQGAVRGGTVVMVGLLPTGLQPVPISLAITRELQLKGPSASTTRLTTSSRPSPTATLNVDPVVTHEFPLAEALEGFEMARNSAESGKVLLNFA